MNFLPNQKFYLAIDSLNFIVSLHHHNQNHHHHHQHHHHHHNQKKKKTPTTRITKAHLFMGTKEGMWRCRMDRSSKQKRVLVTGGAGFIGSHLCEKLLLAGHHVLCIDNYYTGSRQNVAHLMNDPSFELQRHDITFPLYVEVDQIYNLACPASPIHYQKNPVQTIKTNLFGAIHM